LKREWEHMENENVKMKGKAKHEKGKVTKGT